MAQLIIRNWAMNRDRRGVVEATLSVGNRLSQNEK